MTDLEKMNKDELKMYAKEKGIRLFTTVPEKMRERIKEVEYVREHHGDAFRKQEV